jgi:diacylglycerol kinase (ATP)
MPYNRCMASAPKHALVFLNPRAGSGDAERLRSLLTHALDQHGWKHDWINIEKGITPTALIPHLKQAVESKTTRVFACGGDGTASLVASAIISAGLKDQLPLAIFPSGTANSLSRELGIPADWSQAAQVLCTLEEMLELDAMQMGDKHYFLRIGAGVDAQTIHATSRDDKRRLGRWAYFKSFLGRFFRPHRIHFRCMIDGRRRRFWAVQVFVANGGSIALVPFRIGPDISLSDGILNVCAYDALSWWDYFTLGWKLFRRDYQNQPLLKFWTVRHQISIEAKHSVPVQGDGEARACTPITITLVPKALQVIAPRPVGA